MVRKELKSFLPAPLLTLAREIRAVVLSLGLPRYGSISQPESECEASHEMSVVVAICDSPQVLRRCLVSLQLYAPQSEIILVDDASALEETRGLIEEYRSRNGWLLVRHEKSRGHSRSCEAGAKLATRPYLCMLNSDTVVTPWSWSAAKDAFEADPQIGITGPSTSHAATLQIIPRAAHCRYHWNDSQIHGFARRYVLNQPPQAWVDLPRVGGFAFFVRRSLWEELGGFDPNLPDYGNESEFCQRALRQGWRIVWTQNSYIHHFGHQSYGRMGEGVIPRLAQGARAYIDRKHSS